MSLESNIWNLSSMVIGAIITWGVSYFYYIKSSKDLVKELESFRKWNRTLARTFDERFPSDDHFNYDNEGNPVGTIKTLKAMGHGSSRTEAHEEIKQNNAPTKTNE
jgi:hypothetical protein